jgi:hypothetical protein
MMSTIIRYLEVVGLFMAACPDLVDPWLEQCIEGDLDPSDGRELNRQLRPRLDAQPQLNHYLAFNVLVPYVLSRYAADELGCLPMIFNLIERVIVEGDAIASEWAVISFIEDLQGVVLRRRLDDATFFPWMGPQSRQAWRHLHKSWGTGATADHAETLEEPRREDARQH